MAVELSENFMPNLLDSFMPGFLDIGAKHSGTSWIFKNLAKHLQIKLTKKRIAFFDQESLKKPSRYCQMLVPNPLASLPSDIYGYFTSAVYPQDARPEEHV